MKFLCVLLFIIGACCAVPVDQAKSSSSDEAAKTKRGVYYGADYHAPLLTQSAYLSAPATAAVVHHAPALAVAHAPTLAVAHAPTLAVAHAPVYTSHSLYPTALHSYYHH